MATEYKSGVYATQSDLHDMRLQAMCLKESPNKFSREQEKKDRYLQEYQRIDRAHKASIEKRKEENTKKAQKTSMTQESVTVEAVSENIWTDPYVRNVAGVMMLEFIYDHVSHERKTAMEHFLKEREGQGK